MGICTNPLAREYHEIVPVCFAVIFPQRSSPFQGIGLQFNPHSGFSTNPVSTMLRHRSARHWSRIFSPEHCRYSPNDFATVIDDRSGPACFEFTRVGFLTVAYQRNRVWTANR